mgnify:CR=1 FL=1
MQQSGEQQVRPPVPPFTEETARQKVKAAQDAWNTRDPEKVSLAYTEDSAAYREVMDRLVQAWGDKVFHTVIRRTVKFSDSTVAGEPISQLCCAQYSGVTSESGISGSCFRYSRKAKLPSSGRKYSRIMRPM